MYICALCNPLNVTSWHSVSQLFAVMRSHPGWPFSATARPHSESPLLCSRLLTVRLCFTVPTFPQPVLPQTAFCSNLLTRLQAKFMIGPSVYPSVHLSVLSVLGLFQHKDFHFSQCHKGQKLLFTGGTDGILLGTYTILYSFFDELRFTPYLGGCEHCCSKHRV